MPDAPRFLDRRPGHSYTENPTFALRGEPEAVPAEYQAELTDRAARDAQLHLQTEWVKCRDRVLGAVEHFEQTARPPKPVLRNSRLFKRAAAALDRDILGR